MWQAGTLILISASFLVVLQQLRQQGADKFLVLAVLLIWVRLAAAALGDVALQTEFAGFSLIALSTLGMTCLGLLLIPLHLLRIGWATPFYVFIGFGVLSGLLNGATGALQNFLVLWAYFVVVSLLLYRSFLVHGQRPVFGCLLAAFSLPFAMQLMSIVMSMPKISPDGTLNYIGGYGHEAIFSLVAVSALWLAMTYPWAQVAKGLVVVGCIVASLLLANYRTIIIAILPLLIVYLFFCTGPARVLRGFIIPLIVAGALLPSILPEDTGSRFSEIGPVISGIGDLTKRPEEYTAREKDILSARAYIWSVYFYGFRDAATPQLLVGHGPDARSPFLTVHPHNEYLRILYEFGAVGAILWFGILLQQLRLLVRARPHPASLLTAAGFVTVLLTALGTSLFNRPEGIVLLALLCSTTWYISDQRSMVPRSGNLQLPVRSVGGNTG